MKALWTPALEKKSRRECVERAARGGSGMRSGKGCAPAAALPGRPGARREWSLRVWAHDERLSARCGRGAGERRRRPSRRAWREGPPSWRRRWRVSLGQRRSSSPLAGAEALKSRKRRWSRNPRRKADAVQNPTGVKTVSLFTEEMKDEFGYVCRHGRVWVFYPKHLAFRWRCPREHPAKGLSSYTRTALHAFGY